MYPATHMKDLNQSVLANHHQKAIDIYNHWLVNHSLKMKSTRDVLNMIDYIDKLKKMEPKELEFLTALE